MQFVYNKKFKNVIIYRIKLYDKTIKSMLLYRYCFFATADVFVSFTEKFKIARLAYARVKPVLQIRGLNDYPEQQKLS